MANRRKKTEQLRTPKYSSFDQKTLPAIPMVAYSNAAPPDHIATEIMRAARDLPPGTVLRLKAIIATTQAISAPPPLINEYGVITNDILQTLINENCLHYGSLPKFYHIADQCGPI